MTAGHSYCRTSVRLDSYDNSRRRAHLQRDNSSAQTATCNPLRSTESSLSRAVTLNFAPSTVHYGWAAICLGRALWRKNAIDCTCVQRSMLSVCKDSPVGTLASGFSIELTTSLCQCNPQRTCSTSVGFCALPKTPTQCLPPLECTIDWSATITPGQQRQG